MAAVRGTFEVWFGDQLPQLVRFATVLCGGPDLAEDVLQDVALKAHRRWSRVRELDQPEAYLRRMIVNEHLSWRRKWGRIIPHAVLTERLSPESDFADRHADRLRAAVMNNREGAYGRLRTKGLAARSHMPTQCRPPLWHWASYPGPSVAGCRRSLGLDSAPIASINRCLSTVGVKPESCSPMSVPPSIRAEPGLRLSRGFVVTAVVGGAIVIATLIYIGVGGRSSAAPGPFGTFASFGFLLFATFASALGTRRRDVHFRAWFFLTIALSLCSVSSAVTNFYSLTTEGGSPLVTLGDFAYLAYVIPSLAALLAMPLPPTLRTARWRLVLDALIITLAVLFISWVTVLESVVDTFGLNTVEGWVRAAFPVVDVIVYSAVATLGMRSPPSETLTWSLLGCGLTVLAVTDSVHAGLVTKGSPDLGTSPLIIGWIAAPLLIALATMVRTGSQASDRKTTAVHLSRDLIPYLLVLVAVVVSAVYGIGWSAFVLIIGGLLLVCLVARQVMIVLENMSLTVSLETRVSELVVAREDALESSRVKSEFLATMSHEIRTPMNGVIGLTELLMVTPLNQVQRQYAEGVKSSGDALLTVINDVLDFSKLEAGKVDLEHVDFSIGKLVDEVGSLLAPVAAKKSIELMAYCQPDVPDVLRGDPGRIRQILLNLASNAVKFTAVGEVAIKVEAVDIEDDAVRVRFEVSDTGIGIDEAGRAMLFQSFSQVDASTTRRYGGTGLGLAISSRLVQAMQGAIDVSSRPGYGSTFWFEIPLARGDAPVTDPLALSRDQLAGKRVIVVDDNATNRQIVAEHLTMWAAHADVAENAHSALSLMRAKAAQGRPYDIAVLDMCMPDVDGLELASTISAEPGLQDTRMMLLTSTLLLDTAAIERAGIGEWLPKPVRSSHLYDGLLRLVRPPSASGAVVTETLPAQATRTRSLDRILVVEDNSLNQLVAEGVVSALGYEATIVSNGREALEALSSTSYAAVLMDCHMPIMDGFEATREIRRRPDQNSTIPIIAMTAGAMTQDREVCLAAGMDDYVSKPIDLEALGELLRKWVRTDPTTKIENRNHDSQLGSSVMSQASRRRKPSGC